MPLTPTSHDKNRTVELKRKEEDPASFGVGLRDNPLGGRDRKTDTQLKLEEQAKQNQVDQEAIAEALADLKEREAAIQKQEDDLRERRAVFDEQQSNTARKSGRK